MFFRALVIDTQKWAQKLCMLHTQLSYIGLLKCWHNVLCPYPDRVDLVYFLTNFDSDWWTSSDAINSIQTYNISSIR